MNERYYLPICKMVGRCVTSTTRKTTFGTTKMRFLLSVFRPKINEKIGEFVFILIICYLRIEKDLAKLQRVVVMNFYVSVVYLLFLVQYENMRGMQWNCEI
jgi:hypothetical protein